MYSSNLQSFTHTVMMVRPACFGFNEDTAKDNAFQTNNLKISPEEISKKAIDEFDLLVKKLQENNIVVEVVQDTKDIENPDAVFPNNWISFHEPDFIVTYPMFSVKRRRERRKSTIEFLKNSYIINKNYRYENFESENEFLEGTGSMILDREYRIAYACRSERTNEHLFYKFCDDMEFSPFLFDAKDKDGIAIYHTNVMLCLGVNFVIICMDSITKEKDRIMLKDFFKATGKKIINVSLNQMSQYAGNMIQLKN